MNSFFAKLLRRFRGSKPLASSEDATRVFLELFRGHDLPCRIENGWIRDDSGLWVAQARIAATKPTPAIDSVQLDFIVVLVANSDGRTIIESFAGFGESLHAAIGNAIQNCVNGSFHVLLSLLTSRPNPQCEVETWEVNGTTRRVTIGPIVSRGSAGPGVPPSAAWFPTMERQIRESDLSGGLHWVRFFHFQNPGGATVNEALLDNEDRPDWAASLGACEWPPVSGLYTARLFLTLDDSPPASGG